jgi:Holliday junction DNA helicase RuvA
MFSFIKGTLKVKEPLRCVVAVGSNDGELGYDVHIPLSTYEALGDLGSTVELHVYTYTVRDEFQLYGFARLSDKNLFGELIKLPGIGPGLALRVLSGMSSGEFLSAVREGDAGLISRIKGIGRKRAERMVFELGGILPKLEESVRVEAGETGLKFAARDALVSLGLKKVEAENAVRAASAMLGEDATLEDLIKIALSSKS